MKVIIVVVAILFVLSLFATEDEPIAAQEKDSEAKRRRAKAARDVSQEILGSPARARLFHERNRTRRG